MDELFLHYVWQFQHFDKSDLKTIDNQSIEVYHAGKHNHDAGPDFTEAKIKLGDLVWAGNVEIHHRSSDWKAHGHDQDAAYQNVVLHVVWQHDMDVLVAGNPVPTLALADLVDANFLKEYDHFVKASKQLPCQDHLHKVPGLLIKNMFDRALVERLSLKSMGIQGLLDTLQKDWEETTYQVLLEAFGRKTNSAPFKMLARFLPFKIIKKHANNPLDVESLFFGTAGFLNGQQSEYAGKLENNFKFLSKKYELSVVPATMWKFSKLRLPNFPTVKLAQLAALLGKVSNLYSTIIQTSDVKDIKSLINLDLPPYWQQHYHFGKKLKRGSNQPGKTFVDHLMINVVVPILYASGKYLDDQSMCDRAIGWLEMLGAENNKTTRKYTAFGLKLDHAGDSQAALHLHESYCSKKRCLTCSIGTHLLKPDRHVVTD